MCSVGLAVDLQDGRPVHHPVHERHGQRRMNQILTPFVEIDVRQERRGALAAERKSQTPIICGRVASGTAALYSLVQ